jgi:toxic protein SymE
MVLKADGDEVQELREQLYQSKQMVKGIKDGEFSVLSGG